MITCTVNLIRWLKIKEIIIDICYMYYKFWIRFEKIHSWKLNIWIIKNLCMDTFFLCKKIKVEKSTFYYEFSNNIISEKWNYFNNNVEMSMIYCH